MGSSSKKQTVGYFYLIGVHLVLGYRVEGILEVFVGGKSAWKAGGSHSILDEGTFSINAPYLFGGPDREGGIIGDVDLLNGKPDQAVNGYLQSKIGGNIPAFRQVCSLVLKQVYVGMSPYLKDWSVKVRRTGIMTDGTEQWLPYKASIGSNGASHMGPAHIIWECLIDDQWGMGYSVSSIDTHSFANAANTLYDEKFGLSFIWNQSTSIEDFLQEVLNHIDARLRVSPSSGLWELFLIRKIIYGQASLVHLDPSNVLELTSFSRIALGETINEVSVVYRDVADNKDKTVTVQNLGNIQMQGTVLAQKIEYPGIPDAELAARVAQRDLIARSTPLSKVHLKADRVAHRLAVGDAFDLTWPELGLDALVYRVGSITMGTLEDPAISIIAVQDIFDIEYTTYNDAQPIGWVDPSSDPVAFTLRAIYEAPYWDIKTNTSFSPDIYDPDFGFVMTVASAESGDTYGYEVWASPGGYQHTGEGIIAPTATLQDDLDKTATSFVYTDGSGKLMLDIDIGDHAYIEEEMVHIKSVDTVTRVITVDRAILDSVPTDHLSGARVWFSGGHMGIDEVERVTPESVHITMLPTTSKGTLDLGDGLSDQLYINNRYQRPYPPGRFRINNVAFPTTVGGTLTFTWAHRDRTQQLAYFTTQNEGDIGPEVGATYEFELKDGYDQVVDQAVGITGTTRSFTPSGLGMMTVTIKTKVGTLESLHTVTHEFLYGSDYSPSETFNDSPTADYVPTEDFYF